MEPFSADHEWEKIYQRHVDTVYRLCYMYLRNAADAEDAVQSVFLKLLGREMSFSDSEHAKAWLVVATRNYCKDFLKSWWKTRRVRLDKLPELARQADKETTTDMLEKLLKLPEKYKTVLYLYYYENYAVKEIAAMLGRKESTVQTQLAAGRKRLKTEMGDSHVQLSTE
ncbi:sigma-70 family RNA polymerase sigma factor [Paenibacillus albiflavus]|uniref:Sigma-70 family RNA polymerase sigma factor n=1 Tax=Paenibacillus albiflavus TaxID=2545760 RepID=A0A4R4EKU0_9BACL|nr:sigma-70 family RNA polymerase sigma factor [Paenibacillus albiflavus]TCZ78915.1 sigma-70 family RNA polymerase sigma factor [Paenibacillus albiflavus]